MRAPALKASMRSYDATSFIEAEIAAATTTNEAIHVHSLAPSYYKQAATDKIVQVSRTPSEIIAAYSYLWHMDAKDKMFHPANEILLGKLKREITDTIVARVAYDEAVYERWLPKSDQLVLMLADYSIMHASATTDLLDKIGQELPHEHCSMVYDQEKCEFMTRKIEKATTIRELGEISESKFFSPELQDLFDKKTKEIYARIYGVNLGRRREDRGECHDATDETSFWPACERRRMIQAQ